MEHWINTDAFSYPLIIGRGNIKRVGSIIRDKNLIAGEKIALVTSPTVFEYWGDDVAGSFSDTGLDIHLVKIPDGEQAKELSTLNDVYGALVHIGFHRDGLIVALGGGSVSDVAGFAAGTYLRGVDYINVPTTLLAQIDSCVGGKTGINHEGGKNLIGAFWQPRGVIVDPDIVGALEQRQVMSGLAEAVKAAVVGDEELFNLIEDKFEALAELTDLDALDAVIERAR
jgi:3-dehydroquinate synthase